MLEETGVIAAVEADALWVETIQRSHCASCVAQKGCGQSLLSKVGVKPTYIRVLLDGRNSKNYSVGQDVTIGIPDDVVVKSSLFIYLLPLLLIIVFSGIAHTYIQQEWFSICAGLIGLCVGGGVIRYHADKSRNDPRLQPILIDEHHKLIVKETNARGV